MDMDGNSSQDDTINVSGVNSVSTATNLLFQVPGSSEEIQNEVHRSSGIESNLSSDSSVSITIMNNDVDSRTQSPTTPSFEPSARR